MIVRALQERVTVLRTDVCVLMDIQDLTVQNVSIIMSEKGLA